MKPREKRLASRYKIQFDHLETKSLLSTAGALAGAGEALASTAGSRQSAVIVINSGGVNASTTTSHLGRHARLIARRAIRAQAATNYVTGLYNAYLGRAPEAQELDLWVGALEQGLSRKTIRRHILRSAEYQQTNANVNGNSTLVAGGASTRNLGAGAFTATGTGTASNTSSFGTGTGSTGAGRFTPAASARRRFVPAIPAATLARITTGTSSTTALPGTPGVTGGSTLIPGLTSTNAGIRVGNNTGNNTGTLIPGLNTGNTGINVGNNPATLIPGLNTGILNPGTTGLAPGMGAITPGNIGTSTIDLIPGVTGVTTAANTTGSNAGLNPVTTIPGRTGVNPITIVSGANTGNVGSGFLANGTVMGGTSLIPGSLGPGIRL